MPLAHDARVDIEDVRAPDGPGHGRVAGQDGAHARHRSIGLRPAGPVMDAAPERPRARLAAGGPALRERLFQRLP